MRKRRLDWKKKNIWKNKEDEMTERKARVRQGAEAGFL